MTRKPPASRTPAASSKEGDGRGSSDAAASPRGGIGQAAGAPGDAPATTTPSRAVLRRAGWRMADVNWERLQEEGNALFRAGDAANAARLWRLAGWIAFWRLRRTDPRYATTLANLALADRHAGREERARKRYERARRIWEGTGEFIEKMTIARRGRSSLFHMRMEAKHWETYARNTRIRMTAFSREAAGALEALAAGQPVKVRLYSRWRGEKPAVFDDTRKLLAAALLIAAPGEGAAGKQKPGA